MNAANPIRKLERRTAAGEIAPLAMPDGRSSWYRSFHDFPFFGADARTSAAARRQLRLRRKLGVADRPVDPRLADFRARCVHHDDRGEEGGLGALLPDDSLGVVILLLPDLRFEELLCGLLADSGPLPADFFAGSHTVGDLLDALALPTP